jgi:hypothetical protein
LAGEPWDSVYPWWSGAGAFTSGNEQPELPVKVLQLPKPSPRVRYRQRSPCSQQRTPAGCSGTLLRADEAGAIFVNTARGEVVDYAALEKAVRERGIRAGLDVFPGEPAGATATFSMPMRRCQGCTHAPHRGSTDQAQEAIAAETVRVIPRT